LANLQSMVQKNMRVTSNQADLFDRLIEKYGKQLAKNNIKKEDVMLLPWESTIVESTPEYTGAVVSIDDDEIIIRVPFNKTFISSFRDIPHNSFEWNRELKIYKSKFSTRAFNIAATKLYKYFPTVKFCETSQVLLDSLKRYETATVWDPTLMMVNGRLMLVACSAPLLEAISDIELTLEPLTLYKLSQYGIKIDPELTKNDPTLKFAADRSVQIEASDGANLVKMIKSLGCSNVLWGRGINYSKIGKEVQAVFVENGITLFPPGKTSPEHFMLITLYDSTVNMNYPGMGKLIVLKDSRPIEAK